MDEKLLDIVYQIAHLTELYAAYRSWSQAHDEPIQTLREFAARLEAEGNPLGDGLDLKQPPTRVSLIVPVDDLWAIYQEQPGRPEVTLAQFVEVHDKVSRFRQETGHRKHLE